MLRSHDFSLHSKSDSGKSEFFITNTQTLENFIIRCIKNDVNDNIVQTVEVVTPLFPLIHLVRLFAPIITCCINKSCNQDIAQLLSDC